jgi:hypothetical protein
MQNNVGNTDRILRIIVGLALLSLIFLIDSNWRWIGLLGAVMIFTALVRWCPAYSLVGMNTNKKQQG